METLVTGLRDLAVTMVPVAVVFAALALVTKRRKVIEAFRRARHEGATNFWLLILNTVLLAPLFAIPSGAVQEMLGVVPGMALWWSNAPAVLTFAVAILLLDFTAYWRHRLEHDGSLWRFHATHHADEAMHWLSVQRKHPVGRFLSVLIDPLPLFFLGLPIWAIAAAFIVRSWWGYFTHADVPWTLGPLGKWLISPPAHRLHHARDEKLAGKNFANTFAFIDRAFGTYADPEPHIGCATGVAEGSRSFFGELWRPFERSVDGHAEAIATERDSKVKAV